jgi:hypothetical protein
VPAKLTAGGTRDIDGFLQPDGVTKYAFTFAAPEESSDSQSSSASLTPSLAESSARPATAADSIGRIRVQIFAATARQVLKVPEPPPPRTSYSGASSLASASALKREYGSATPDGEHTASKRGKVEAAASQPPADVGMPHQAEYSSFRSTQYHGIALQHLPVASFPPFFIRAGFTALQKPSTTEMDEKKFWKNSLGTTVGPMIAGPALHAASSGNSASASSFGGASASASSPKSTPKPASTRPVLETKWELNHLLGTVTFRYSTFSGLVLSQIVKIDEPSDARMIPMEELSIHAVKVVAGVIKSGGDTYDARVLSYVLKYERLILTLTRIRCHLSSSTSAVQCPSSNSGMTWPPIRSVRFLR